MVSWLAAGYGVGVASLSSAVAALSLSVCRMLLSATIFVTAPMSKPVAATTSPPRKASVSVVVVVSTNPTSGAVPATTAASR